MNYLQGVREKMRGITSRCTLKKSYEWKSKHLYVWFKNKDDLNIIIFVDKALRIEI